MTIEQQKQIVEEILGSPLPELDPIFYEGAKKYMHMSPNTFMTPYLMSEVYTKEEMSMVALLPATAPEVAEKLGLEAAYVESVLEELDSFGKIVGSNVQKPRLYSPHLNLIAFRDSIGTGRIAHKLDWMPYIKAYKLMDQWIRIDYDPAVAEAIRGEMRVIPKWESIKDIPGVMYCENMKEIIERNVRNNAMTTSQCVCRTYRSYIDLGRYDPDYCTAGTKEVGGVNGHCFSFNRQAEFFSNRHDTYKPNTEEAMLRLKEADEALFVYTTPNTRDTTFVCSCCDDCCANVHYEKKGYEVRAASRFRPTWNEDKCVGCEACLSRCMFDALKMEDGKIIIDEVKCRGCGNCVVVCPTKALKMKIVHDPDWIPDIPYVDGWSVHDELTEEDKEAASHWKAETPQD